MLWLYVIYFKLLRVLANEAAYKLKSLMHKYYCPPLEQYMQAATIKWWWGVNLFSNAQEGKTKSNEWKLEKKREAV